MPLTRDVMQEEEKDSLKHFLDILEAGVTGGTIVLETQCLSNIQVALESSLQWLSKQRHGMLLAVALVDDQFQM